MNALIYEFPVNRTWQASYKAAIAEVDSTKIPVLIAEAKKKLSSVQDFYFRGVERISRRSKLSIPQSACCTPFTAR
jgi:hypothetical protein